jgi:hypothetical protein
VGRPAYVAPVRLKVWDEALGVDKIITVGYQGYCPCGRQTGQEDTYAAARRAIMHHKAHDHGHRGAEAGRQPRGS